MTQKKAAGAEGLASVAFWQFMAFLMLVLLIWLNEFMDLSALWYGTKAKTPDLLEGFILTAGIILTAIVTVGHTYEQQRQIIRGLLTVCSYCHRVQIESEAWSHIDEYITDHSKAMISHSICPDCFRAMQASIAQANAPAPPAETGAPAPTGSGPTSRG